MKYLIIEDEMHNAQLLEQYINQIKTDALLLAILPSVTEAFINFLIANLRVRILPITDGIKPFGSFLNLRSVKNYYLYPQLVY